MRLEALDRLKLSCMYFILYVRRILLSDCEYYVFIVGYCYQIESILYFYFIGYRLTGLYPYPDPRAIARMVFLSREKIDEGFQCNATFLLSKTK